jgi:hypothetical protein
MRSAQLIAQYFVSGPIKKSIGVREKSARPNRKKRSSETGLCYDFRKSFKPDSLALPVL